MKLAYVAGPYRSDSEYGVIENIRRAEAVALELWAAGYAVFCPHKNTALFGGARGLPDKVWLDGDLEILRRCDLVVMCPNWGDNEGTRTEIEAAREEKIPVWFWSSERHRAALTRKEA